MRSLFLALLVLLVTLVAQSASARAISIASWNLNNLHHVAGEPLRDRAPVRYEEDYATLRLYAERLNADIIALQEVNGPQAARRVFPPAQYELYFSGRYAEDRANRRASDRIYTGFAVRRRVFTDVSKRDYADIGVGHGDRRTRWGTDLLVAIDGRQLRLLSVHLKSGCPRGSLERSRSGSCATLAQQREPLEAWIDARAVERVPFVIVGDFNRAFDVHGARDHLWREVDDSDPAGLNLTRLPFKSKSKCWRGTSAYHVEPIDFFVFDARAWQRVKRASFTQLTYEPRHRDIKRRTPSDHCPIRVEIDL
jgi:endonuclease/exonuclease/phosphatase family metal-dependent hydrolase